MKRTLYILIFLLFANSLYAINYKPIYIGDSICNGIMIRDQSGNPIVPAANDVVTLTLKRSLNSAATLIVITGVYSTTHLTDDRPYNFSFNASSTSTENFGTGDAYWILCITNSVTIKRTIIDVSKVTIKQGL